MTSDDFYSRLKISRNATPDQIRKAYFQAARMLHPDSNPDPDASEQFIRLQEAYEILSDEEKRSAYDLSLGGGKIDADASVNLIFSRDELPRINEPQLVYVLLELTPPAKPDNDLAVPINLSLVVDRSTSMSGARLDIVKANLINLIRKLKPDSIVSVVGFSDRAELLVPASRLADIKEIENRIQLLKPGGGTEIRYGIDAGLEEIRRNLNPRYINHLILLTDGHTYGDEAACLELAQIAANQRIGISCLGIGDEWNDAFLDKLAGLSGGNSLFISKVNDLEKFLTEKMKHLNSIYAEGVRFDFECDEETELQYAFRLMPDLSPLIVSRSMCLGNILTSSGLTVILEFLVKPVPKRKSEITLSRGKLWISIPSRITQQTFINLIMTRPMSNKMTANSTNTKIFRAISQLTLYRIQERARNEVKSGNIDDATNHLVNLATHLLSLGEQELAQTVLEEANNLKTENQFSKEGDKKIKYGTRALIQITGGTSETP